MELLDFAYQDKYEMQLRCKAHQVIDDTGEVIGNELAFSACIAAGKTKMCGRVSSYLGDDYSDVAFVWISPSDGNLHLQTLQAMREYGFPNLTIRNLQEMVSQDGRDGKVKPGTLNVLGWSDIISKKKNLQRQMGESPTFESLMLSNRGKTKIIVFRDESQSFLTEKAEEVIKLISPVLIVKVTATLPQQERIKAVMNNALIEIPPEEVAAEGKIKHTICVNDAGWDDSCISSFDDEGVIAAGVARRKLLADEYAKVGLTEIPFVIIQVSNDESYTNDSSTTIDNATEAKTLLLKHGAKEEDIAIWLANEKNVDPLSLKNSHHKYVITKLAFTKGWDCSRTHVLVKLRATSKSDILEEQTGGRTLRTVNLAAWQENEAYRSNKMLNTAFIYTADENYDISLRRYHIQSRTIQPDMWGIHRPYWEGVRLVSVLPGRKHYNGMGTEIKRDLVQMLNKRFPADGSGEWSTTLPERYIARFSTPTAKVYKDLATNGRFEGGVDIVELTPACAEGEFYKRLKETPCLRRHFAWITEAIKRHVEDNLYDGERDDLLGCPSDIDKLQFKFEEFLLAAWDNYDDFVASVLAVFDKHAQYEENQVMDGGADGALWQVPLQRYASSVSDKSYGNFAYNQMDKLIEDSTVESAFVKEVLLNKADSWFKNATFYPEGFCITRTDAEGNMHKFFNDYMMNRNRTLYLLEIKGSHDGKTDMAITPEDDKFRAKAISEWMNSNYLTKSLEASEGIDRIVFGICRKISGVWKIYCGDSSDYEDVTSSNWRKLSDVIAENDALADMSQAA